MNETMVGYFFRGYYQTADLGKILVFFNYCEPEIPDNTMIDIYNPTHQLSLTVSINQLTEYKRI